MRIAFLLTQSLEGPGGAGRVLPMAKALARRGHAVKIIALHHDYAALAERRFRMDGVEVCYVGQMQVRKVGSTKTYFSTPRLLWIVFLGFLRLAFEVLRTPADIVQVCKAQPMNLLAAYLKHLFQGTPIFLDSDDYERLNNRFKYRWQQEIVAWFERWAATFCDGITVTNRFLYRFYRSLGYPEERLTLIPHGYDPLRFAVLDEPDAPERVAEIRARLGLAPGQKVVVFIGSVSLVCHAIDLLLEAFPRVMQSVPGAALVIVGGGEAFYEMRALAQSLGTARDVHFTGRVARDEVPYYFRLGDASVDPKREGELESAILPLKVVESLAAGVPCVSGDIGDSAEILGGAGVMVKPGSVDALADGLIAVLRDEALAAALRARALERREAYSWEHMAAMLLGAYARRGTRK